MEGSSPTRGRGPWLQRTLPWLFLHASVAAVFAWAATQATWKLLGGEFLGVLYDELGRSLLRADVSVPLNHESFFVHGKPVVYFGAFPALVRILPNLLAPSHFGEWSRLSCLLAALVCHASFLRIVVLALGGPMTRFRAVTAATLSLSFAFGSPLLFLVSQPYLYHEAILWGLAGSLLGLAGALALFLETGNELGHRTLLAVGFFVALHSRITFGIPIGLLVVLSGTGLFRGPAAERLARVRSFLVGNVPVLLAVAFQGWYNFARWGSVFRLIDQDSYIIFLRNPDQMEVVRNVGNFDFMRIPSTFHNYFAPRAAFLSAQFPWFRMSAPDLFPGWRFIQYREWTISLLLSAPWLVLLGAGGLVLSLRAKGTPAAIRLAPFAFLPEVAMVLTFYFVSERYLGDFLPLLVAGSVLSLRQIAEISSPRIRRVALGGLVGLGLFAIVATATSTLHWMASLNWAMDPARQADLAKLIGCRPLR
jgi:hypothetical protein